MKIGKLITAAQAVKHIPNGSTVAIGGSGGGIAEPTALIDALGERYQETSTPQDLTFIHVTGLGDRKEGGMCKVAFEGLVKRNIGGHWDYLPKMASLASENKIEAYNFPQGVLSQLFRETAAARTGLITHVGLKTFVDPRLEGGKLNKATTEDLVHIVQIRGEEKLYYPSYDLDFAFLRGTTADEDGNITMEEEAAFLDNLAIAQAVHNQGGKVYVQVKQLAQAGSLHPKKVRIPGMLVDGIIVEPSQKQTVITDYNPAYAGELKVPLSGIDKLPYDERKIISMRAAHEIKGNKVVNLGVGISGSVGIAAMELGIPQDFCFAVEHGVIGGVPASGIEFGAASNPTAIIDTPSQFDFFDGGGIDLTCLGMAQVDAKGNVNVSKLGDRIIGCGGFINIAQNAKQIVFCGTFTSGGLRIEVIDGRLKILQEGKYKKFIKQVDQITFSGEYAIETNQKVLFVTERAVFGLNAQGLVLQEIAPGMEVRRDVLDHIDFEVHISEQLKIMESSLFSGLGGELE